MTKAELHDEITDRICELENCFDDPEGYSAEEFAEIERMIDHLENVRNICDEYPD